MTFPAIGISISLCEDSDWMPMNPSQGYLTISLNCIVCLAIFVWLLFMTAFDLPAKFMIIGEQTKDFCMHKVCFLGIPQKN